MLAAVTGGDGLHRLAEALPAVAAPAGRDLAASSDGPAAARVSGAPVRIALSGKETEGTYWTPTTLSGGYWAALAVLAVALIGLVAAGCPMRIGGTAFILGGRALGELRVARSG